MPPRIAVIGAGASGLTAALALTDRGYADVAVFEADGRVGGKTYSYVHDGTAYDMGSMMFTRGDETSRLADRFGVPYRDFHATDFYVADGRSMSPLAFARRAHGIGPLTASLVRLQRIIRKNRLGEAGFAHADPALHAPAAAFFAAHGLAPIAEACRPGVVCLGYGYYEETPALFTLKIMASMVGASPLSLLLSRGRRICYFPGGWSALWEKVASTMDVRTGAAVSAVARAAGERVRVTAGGRTEEFDALIVAAPLQRAGTFLDLSAEEADLFGRIRTVRMVSTLIKATKPLPNAFLADNAVPGRLGHVLGASCYAPETRCSVLFQTVPAGMPREEVRRVLAEDVRGMGAQVEQIVHQQEWPYFPHVGTQDLADGFYRRMEALHGVRGTYYLGGVLNFETVDHCQQFAEHLVRTRF